MRILFLSILILFTATAKPVIPHKDFKTKILKKAGPMGPFARENFPKDYFLIPKNLPYFAGATLHHPKSSSLKLSKKQIEALKEIKKATVPAVLKMSKKIKKIEIEIAKEIALKYKIKKAESLYKKVDEVSKLRTKLTKAHLKCIEKVKTVLNEKQFKTLLDYTIINK